MGWWDESIMGGDTPLDFKGLFEERFEVGGPVPTAEEAVDFIYDRMGIWGGGDDHTLKQVVGFLMIERAAPFNDLLRELVLEGLDKEIVEGCEDWNEPEVRIASLRNFRKIVEAYPNEGAKVEIPPQPGLLDKFAESLSPGKHYFNVTVKVSANSPGEARKKLTSYIDEQINKGCADKGITFCSSKLITG